MIKLRLRFHVFLRDFSIPDILGATGPIFHQFVPDGQNDAVHLTPADDPHDIRVWFERFAKSDGTFLHWDRDGKDFDESIMRRQGKLEAGPLYGEMHYPYVTDAEMAALEKNPKGLKDSFGQDNENDPNYLALAKRVIEVLQPRLSTFVATLRNQYGQYWLTQVQPWDSRSSTLGSYCSSALGPMALT